MIMRGLALAGGTSQYSRESFNHVGVSNPSRSLAITPPVLSETKLEHDQLLSINHLLGLFSACIEAVVHASSEQQLLSDICRLIVTHGGYLMSWVGMAENVEGGSIYPVAEFGFPATQLGRPFISSTDKELVRESADRVIRTGITQVHEGFMENPAMEPWLDATAGTRIRSCVCLPLQAKQEAFGVLSIYSGESCSFSAEEVKLLEVLAGNLGYGILTLRDKAKQQVTVQSQRKVGSHFPWMISARQAVLDNVLYSYEFLIDFTAHKKAEEKFQHLACYDQLTSLPNRILLIEHLKHSLTSSARHGRHGALLLIDLDDFKTLNETLGHEMGDKLLQKVGRRLKSCLRESDTLSRFGGDEFVMILEDLSMLESESDEQVRTVCNKILEVLNHPYQLGDSKYRCTPSIGATLFRGNLQSIDDLMKQANIAMFQAKNGGHNTVRVFDPQMQDSINTRTALQAELRKALDNQEFQLHFQFQVDNTGQPMGVEALIRWKHPERGMISPENFIPLAEETGLILPIGQWVFETACAQLGKWKHDENTRNLVLSVNVSARQFRQIDFSTYVRAAVQRHNINPSLLKLELTEGMLLENIEETIATMKILKETGVTFSLDDFGTGYSSLQYLKHLPLDQLKIDQSFIRDLATDSNDKAIVRTIVAMARSLNLNIIAEGVETEEQRQFLMQNGCTNYQGYLFGKPLPIELFETQLRSAMKRQF
jgi:diguanylate cyclase (GGDEF)-like protein